jgi:hypothetical protein
LSLGYIIIAFKFRFILLVNSIQDTENIIFTPGAVFFTGLAEIWFRHLIWIYLGPIVIEKASSGEKPIEKALFVLEHRFPPLKDEFPFQLLAWCIERSISPGRGITTTADGTRLFLLLPSFNTHQSGEMFHQFDLRNSVPTESQISMAS